jgi:hypothetical protein
MPAARPRIVFTPEERSLRALQRISNMTGEPKSAIVTEGVAMLTDHFENLAATLEKAMALKAEARASMAEAAVASLHEIEPQLAEAQRAMDRLNALIDHLGVEPPSSNTGATSVLQGPWK